jgi:2-iminobutanoate/2-iminopropanoate deaminase
MKQIPMIVCIVLLSHMVHAQVVSYPNNPTSKSYSEVVKIDIGTAHMYILSGMVANDAQGKLVGDGDVNAQTEYIFNKIKAALARNGATMDHLVKTTTYMLDVKDVDAFRKIRSRFVNGINPPTSTTVQVVKLPLEGALVEVEAWAVVPK